MKKNDLTEMKSLDEATLLGRAKKVKGEIEDLVMDIKMNKVKDTNALGNKKREVAVMLTIARQKKLLAELEKPEDQSIGKSEDQKIEKLTKKGGAKA